MQDVFHYSEVLPLRVATCQAWLVDCAECGQELHLLGHDASVSHAWHCIGSDHAGHHWTMKNPEIGTWAVNELRGCAYFPDSRSLDEEMQVGLLGDGNKATSETFSAERRAGNKAEPADRKES